MHRHSFRREFTATEGNIKNDFREGLATCKQMAGFS